MKRTISSAAPWGCLLAITAAVAGQGTSVTPASGGAIQETRTTLGKWVETQQILSREKKDWQQWKEILQSRIDLIGSEIGQLKEKLGLVRTDRGKFEGDRAGLLAEKEEIRTTTAVLAGQLGDLEVKIRRLGGALPPSLREKVQPLFERMPADADTTRVSLAERFQNVLGILNEMNRINSEITVATEIRPLSDGKPSEVKTVYIGFGLAYFVSAQGEAGIGHPAETGWTWQPANELAPRINEVLEIMGNKSSPKFVSLPADIQ